MQPSDLQIRTQHASDQDLTFQDLMSERLKQSPWLLMSAAVHAILLAMIWMLTPPDEPKAAKVSVQLINHNQEEVVQPPPPPPPPTQPEQDPEVTTIDDMVVKADTENEPMDTQSESEATQSAFPHNQWSQAVGLSGGAGGIYNGRGVGGEGGGGRSTNPIVRRGLEWLAAHQDKDGRWDADDFSKHDAGDYEICSGPGSAVHDVGVTALALLAFLGENNTMRSGKHQDNVKRGVLWLRDQQDKKTGLIGSRTSHDYIYDHAIAAYAMCEAYGLSNYKLLKKNAQKALNYLEAHRNSYSVWRYQPRDLENDISVTGWAIMAYKSGKFFDLQVNDQAMKLAGAYLDQISDPTGLHGYTKQGERSSRKPGEHGINFPIEKTQALTAVGLFCRFFLDQDPKKTPIMAASANLLTGTPPVWDETDGSIDHYYWYYATYALYQMGGPKWKKWKKQLARAVGDNQHANETEKNLYGSWDPVGAWGEDGGRVYSTAILTLTMQANYRYTRLIR
jgi:hypothetical protein